MKLSSENIGDVKYPSGFHDNIFYPQLSLFFDVLLPMTSCVTEDDFVRGNRGSSFGQPVSKVEGNSRFNMEYARQTLWNDLHGFKIKACMWKRTFYVHTEIIKLGCLHFSVP